MKGLVAENRQLVIKRDLNMPLVGEGEVLVQVKSTTINLIDLEFTKGKYDLFLKLARNNYTVKTGIEFSGLVATDGHAFKKGDRVFGYVNLLKSDKTHQEFVSVNEQYIAKIPANLSFSHAAALPLGALTSYVALNELVNLTSNSKVLIIGASGGLGVYAIQIAKRAGAHVTALTGDEHLQFLKSLGADDVIDYHTSPLESLKDKYDVVLDLSNTKLYKQVKHLLVSDGVFIPAEPNKHFLSFVMNAFRKRKTKYLYVDKGDSAKLAQIANCVAQGEIQTCVDSEFLFDDYQSAISRFLQKGRRGRVVLNFE